MKYCRQGDSYPNNHKEFGVWNRGYTFGSGEYCILFDSIPPDDVSGIFQALVGPPFHSLRIYEEKPSSQKERVLELAREGLSVDDIAESLWFEFGEYLPNGSLRPWQIRRILNTGLGKKAVASV